MGNFSDNDDRLANTITGALLGAVVGGGLGFSVYYVMEYTLLFPGDTIVAGALVCGTLGFILGDGFIEWLKENWWRFW